MKTWDKFVEAKQDTTMVDFFTKRKEGAKKISQEAKAKGGPSLLTHWHFKAKDQPYKEVIQALKNNRSESYFKSKCASLMQRLHNNKLTQQEFQEIIGQLEVWMEATIEIFS